MSDSYAKLVTLLRHLFQLDRRLRPRFDGLDLDRTEYRMFADAP